MRMPGRLLLILAGFVIGAACGPAEKSVVDKYFSAVKQGDNQTLGSFATVGFDKKVEDWKIVQAGEAIEDEAPLPGLIEAVKEIEKNISTNKKEYQDYYFDHQTEVEDVRNINRKKGAIPPKLQSVAKIWDGYVLKERQLKKQLTDANNVMEQERRNVTLSVGEIENVESRLSKGITKQIEVELTIDGQPQRYQMTLRQYKLTEAEKRRVLSRWVVTDLTPLG